MLKKYLIVVLIIAGSLSVANAQSRYIDSLMMKLQRTTRPIEQFRILDDILLNGVGLQGANVDSIICLQMLSVARQLNNDSLLAISYNWMGAFFYINKGDNTSALQYYFKALPLARKAKDKRRISSLYFDISSSYFDLQNEIEGLKYNRNGMENLPDHNSPMYYYMLIQYQNNMANYFFRTHQPDSTLHYAEQMTRSNKVVRAIDMKYNELIFRASAYAEIGDNESADANFRSAIGISDSIHNYKSKLSFYATYIPNLLRQKRISEAEIQAKYLMNLSKRTNNNLLKLSGVSYLRQIYQIRNKMDSAYYYSLMEAEINAKIFKQNNENKIQALNFNELIRDLEEKSTAANYQNRIKQYVLLASLFLFLLIGFILFRNNRQKQRANGILVKTLNDLKSTQSQLIQSEKMASLGELTAGIAHEIQNPLNFVNNFSEVSTELIDEMNEELEKGNTQDVKEIAIDLKHNLEKINHHGKRAGDIVKGMLQHSRSSSGVKEPTDINALADEYLRLAYHGLRAKDKSFNATMKTEVDETIGSINIIPQDIGRVILNLITNAFYAVNQQRSTINESYEPTVSVITKKSGNKILISVKDNGNGIPEHIKEKIFQPFFTTKPTGQGTGLGLSLSYDIVKAHGGELKVETKEGEGSEFIIQLSDV